MTTAPRLTARYNSRGAGAQTNHKQRNRGVAPMAYLPNPRPVEPIVLSIGDVIQFDDGNDWTVKAITEHFAAATRPVTQQDRDDDEYDRIDSAAKVFYTVLDWRTGVRGPCDLAGQAWGDGNYTEAECAEMLAEFEAGNLEISARNWVWLDIRVKARA